MLVVRDLSKTYGPGGEPAMAGLDFTVGERRVRLHRRARPACGKTTLLRCLSGLIAADRGHGRASTARS